MGGVDGSMDPVIRLRWIRCFIGVKSREGGADAIGQLCRRHCQVVVVVCIALRCQLSGIIPSPADGAAGRNPSKIRAKSEQNPDGIRTVK